MTYVGTYIRTRTVSRHKSAYSVQQYEPLAATFISNTTRSRGYASSKKQLCIDSPEQPEVDFVVRCTLTFVVRT